MLAIYVDADACPVKSEVCRVGARYRLPMTFVANQRMRLPEAGRPRLVVVADGLDVADDWIAERVERDDIVITNDIPLAARAVEAGAHVLRPDGKRYTSDNIGGALATRELLAELRGAGEMHGGPPPFKKKDRSTFLQQLDQLVHEIQRAQ